MSIIENSMVQEENLKSVSLSSEVKISEVKAKVSDLEKVDAVENTVKAEDNEKEDVQKKLLSVEEKTEIVEELNKAAKLFDNDIRFVKNNDTEDQTVYVEVYDKESGEVIRRIPPENLKQSLKNISDLTGLLIDQIG